MARQKNKFPAITPTELNEEVVRADMLTADQLNTNLVALADQLGYDGSLTVGALEDEIRFYQRRSAEAILALGTRLLLLKEMTPHGQFKQRIDLLGFSYRTAARFMQAAFKSSKSATVALLAGQMEHSGKFLELVTLDDDDLEALSDGGTVAGLTLDDVERMSVTELRAAIREARENEQAIGRVMANKQEVIDKLATQIVKDAEKHKRLMAAMTPDQQGEDLRREVAGIGYGIEGQITVDLMAAFEALAMHAETNGCTHEEFMSGLLFGIERALLAVRNQHHVKDVPDGDERPDWTRPDFDADAVVAAALAKEAGHA